MHLTRLAIELDLPQQLHVLDVGGGEDLLVFHPAGAARVGAFGQVVGRRGSQEREAGCQHRQGNTCSDMHGRLSEVVDAFTMGPVIRRSFLDHGERHV